MKIYKGLIELRSTGGRLRIIVHENENDKIYDLPHIKRHSLTGFDWGNSGSGPGDAALSILADCVGHEKAYVTYQYFKEDLVAAWKKRPGLCFEITSDEIEFWLESNFIGLDNGNPRRREDVREAQL